ncbi:hypothetical protein V2J09_009887 [Rumex salicifolius]
MAMKRMLLFACVVYSIAMIGGVAAAAQSQKYPALIVFGDSNVDPGNNNNLNTLAKSNFPPYGRDFEGGSATGRFSNGKLPSDLTAEELGIKELIPAYLDPSLRMSDLFTGVSFASGSSGYDPYSAQLFGALGLSDQLNYFEEYKRKLSAAVGDNITEAILSQSLYLIVSGSNDITNTYFMTPVRRLVYDLDSYADLLVGFASTFFQDLYRAGARNMCIANAPPAGCLPFERTLAGGLVRDCVAEYNQLANIFNSKLKSAVQSLNNTLHGANLVFLDIYNPLLDLINNPAKEGFEVADRGCCGTGLAEVSILCTSFDLGTCADASKYVFWDSFHPTEHAYQVLCLNVLVYTVNIIDDDQKE